ncbi:MAG: DinB family protein [Gemmataceae bacterium]|nr:DinB family protein [Gemmataceae bacterium]
MIVSVPDFVRYFKRVRRRTGLAVDRVTPELLDWAPRPGEFTCGEIIRHLAGAERFFVTKVVDDRWAYDLDPGPSVDHETTLAQFHTIHQSEMARVQALDDARLQQPLADLDGRPLKAWVFLMMMVEHEVHHRSQLDCYLAEAGVEPPQLFGVRMEDVLGRIARKS